MTTNLPTAHPTKLNDGSWGVTVDGVVSVGTKIMIETRAGKTWTAFVGAVTYAGPSKYSTGWVTVAATTKTAPRFVPPYETEEEDEGNRAERELAEYECGGYMSDEPRAFPEEI